MGSKFGKQFFLREVIWRAKLFGSNFWEEMVGEQILSNKNLGGGGMGPKLF